MKTLIAMVAGKGNASFPPIMTAAMVYRKARRLGCDSIRVELAGGVRIAEFPLDTVGRFLSHYRLVQQPDRAAVHGRDWETRRPVWPGMTRQPAAKEN